MPDPQEGETSWEDTWANAFEEGFYDNVDGAEDPDKRALIVETDAQGRTRVVGVAEGAEAERLIAEAEASGVEVRRNVSQVESLLREQGSEKGGATDVPPEVYDLMSTVMEFARELSEEWTHRGSDILPRAQRPGRELEFSHEDIEPRTHP